MSGRTIVANLDGEVAWARGARGHAPGLSGDARRLIAALGVTLRVFAEAGDALVTVTPIDPARVPADEAVPELPPVVLVDAPRAGDTLLAWAETDAVERARRGAARTPRPADDATAPLAERVWTLPRAAAAVAGKVNFRGFQCDVARALGCALPGARMVDSIRELEAHLAAGGAAAAPNGRFVLKAGWSAAGRARIVLGPGDDLAKATRLFTRWESLLFEPWMTRVADYGALGLVTDDGVQFVGLHRQEVDAVGRFHGITVLRGLGAATAISALDRLTLEETVRAVGARLADAEYRGPFGIDAWTHTTDGRTVLHPLGEINARLTMGFVAHAAAARLASRWPDDAPVQLSVGRGAPPEGSVALLLPGADDATSAWLTSRERVVSDPG